MSHNKWKKPPITVTQIVHERSVFIKGIDEDVGECCLYFPKSHQVEKCQVDPFQVILASVRLHTNYKSNIPQKKQDITAWQPILSYMN